MPIVIFRERGPDLWCYIAKQDLEAKVIAIEHDTPDNWGGAISLEGDASMSSACNPGDLPSPSACAPRAARFCEGGQMNDNDVLFWRMLALFQCLPELQPAQILAWLTGERDEALTPAYLDKLNVRELEATFPSETAMMSPARWSRVNACLHGTLPAHLQVKIPLVRGNYGWLFVRRMAC
jgi:nitrogen fixation protein